MFVSLSLGVCVSVCVCVVRLKESGGMDDEAERDKEGIEGDRMPNTGATHAPRVCLFSQLQLARGECVTKRIFQNSFFFCNNKMGRRIFFFYADLFLLLLLSTDI